MNTKLITENLAMGILNTEKPVVYGVLNTANFDVMGYYFVAGEDSDCLLDLGCLPSDVALIDKMSVGDVVYPEWQQPNAILIVKIRDDRQPEA